MVIILWSVHVKRNLNSVFFLVLKKQESRSNTLLSQQPSIQCSATSNPVINNNLDTSIAPESKSGDRDQNLISERKKVTKVIKLLAEIHCVLAEVKLQLI